MITLRSHVVVLAIAAGAAGLAGPVASARAGTYTVLSCHDRAGAPAVLADAAGGWVAGSTGGAGLDSVDRCSDPADGFLATVSGIWPHPVGSAAWWRFVAPRGTLIEGADVLYAGYARPFDGQSQGIVYLRSPDGSLPAIDAGSGSLPARWVRLRGLHDAWLQAAAQCDGPVGNGDCRPGSVHATIEVLRSEVVLADSSPPSAGPASGSAVSAATWQGTETFAFAATDEGSGVQRAILEVDGAPVLTRTIDGWDGRCIDTTAGARVFTRPQPCPAAADALVAVDADALPAGEHDVALRVADAAGNRRTVYAARKTIAGPSAPASGPTPAEAPSAAAEGGDVRHAVLVARWARTGAHDPDHALRRAQRHPRAADRCRWRWPSRRAHRAAQHDRRTPRDGGRQGRCADAGRRALHAHRAAWRVLPNPGAGIPRPRRDPASPRRACG
jgi:hypothetical protein